MHVQFLHTTGKFINLSTRGSRRGGGGTDGGREREEKKKDVTSVNAQPLTLLQGY